MLSWIARVILHKQLHLVTLVNSNVSLPPSGSLMSSKLDVSSSPLSSGTTGATANIEKVDYNTVVR